MKKINRESITNYLSNREMKNVKGGNQINCKICHCVGHNLEQSSDDMVWCSYDESDMDFWRSYYCHPDQGHAGSMCH